ncbi:unnamed protein product [Bursaphelenchus xylophilus]|uniref:(pine wood nematode) hypothetical protein n=1 Tax=Bursaphelenchus xylophilus TaxID=6326 RepID=A0A1I7RJQ2_BURXY|nr:unnamed protein product [Bursaphelenchus xylophilus]CAG9128984.1 unnamed protein product [Bursaphelenchus xylophilus]
MSTINLTSTEIIVPYDELGVISLLLRFNFIVTSFAGGILTTLLCFLVICKTEGTLRNYRSILLICSFNDIFYWALDNALAPKLKQTDGVFMIKIEGPARYFSHDVRLILVSIYIFAVCVICSQLPAQMYFRYHCLTRPRPLTTAKTVGLFLLSLVVASPNYYFVYMTLSSVDALRKKVDYNALWYKELPAPDVFFSDARSFYHIVYFVYGGLLISFSYALSLFIGVQTLKKTRRLYDSCSDNTKRLQNQLNNYLTVQSVVPLVVCITPLLFVIVTGFLYIDIGRICMLSAVFLSWMPILNSLITMIVIIPYRKWILQRLLCFKKPNEASVASFTQQDLSHHR